MKDCEIIDKCLLCDCHNLLPVIDLKPTPPANAFVKSNTIQQQFPLNVLQCKNCQHVQLSCIVDREIMYPDYVYVSGTSALTRQHFQNYANKIITNYNLNKDSFVVDIGSNDGTFLSNFKSQNIKVLGIDPAWQIAHSANQQDIETWAQFFGIDVAKNIVVEKGKADVISCNNMFAHNGKLDDIVDGVYHLLKDDGVFVLEVSYLMDVLDTNGFDLIYHEHIHQWHLSPMIKYFEKFNMQIFDIEHVNIQCGSIRVYIKKSKCKKYSINNNVDIFLQKEENIQDKLSIFPNKINKLKDKLKLLLDNYKKNDYDIVGYGASAKSTTLLHYFEINTREDTKLLDAICDDSEWKIGLLTSGTHIKVVSPKYLIENNPDICIILSANFTQDIIKNNSKFNGKWIKIFPEIEEI